MTLFLDVRLSAVGGNLAASVAINQGTDIGNYHSLKPAQLLDEIRGRHVLIATHGFHVNRADGIASLANWEGLLQLAPPSVFVGLLWPGDSIWLHGLDYPEEPRVADEAGQLIAPFLDDNFGAAASISFASHSLGARVLLATVSNMSRPVRRAILMAGAIDDDCLNTEFKSAAAKIGEISILASSEDEVLATAFPLGNFLGGIIAAGHPWWHPALGQAGPSTPWPSNFQAPFEMPDNWDFGHGDYLKLDAPPTPRIAPPIEVAPNGSAEPTTHGWQEAWTAGFASTRFV
jgi:predicted alpha/beta hydrolase family esterase